MPDSPRVIPLPGGRLGRLVDADDAGEVTIHVDSVPIQHLRAHLSWRQHTALEYMARLYGRGGGKRVWAQPGNGSGPADEAAATEYRDLEAAAGQVLGFQIRTLCQGDWPLAPWLRLDHIAAALDRVADRLRLAREGE